MNFESILKEIEQEIQVETEPKPTQQIQTNKSANQKIAEEVVKQLETTKRITEKPFKTKLYSTNELQSIKDTNELKSIFPADFQYDENGKLVVIDKSTGKTFAMSKRYVSSHDVIFDIVQKALDKGYDVYADKFSFMKFVVLIKTNDHTIQIQDQCTGSQKCNVWVDSLDNLKRFGHQKKGIQELKEYLESLI